MCQPSESQPSGPPRSFDTQKIEAEIEKIHEQFADVKTEIEVNKQQTHKARALAGPNPRVGL